MAGIGQTRRLRIPRLLALCAVVVGLFLMHGAPATAAEGCHDAISAPTPVSADHAGAAMTSATSPVMTRAGAQQASGMSAVGGTMCVSTPACDLTPLPLGGLTAVVAVLTAIFLAGRPLILGGTGRHGPPRPGGRSLLLQVCIART